MATEVEEITFGQNAFERKQQGRVALSQLQAARAKADSERMKNRANEAQTASDLLATEAKLASDLVGGESKRQRDKATTKAKAAEAAGKAREEEDQGPQPAGPAFRPSDGSQPDGGTVPLNVPSQVRSQEVRRGVTPTRTRFGITPIATSETISRTTENVLTPGQALQAQAQRRGLGLEEQRLALDERKADAAIQHTQRMEEIAVTRDALTNRLTELEIEKREAANAFQAGTTQLRINQLEEEQRTLKLENDIRDATTPLYIREASADIRLKRAQAERLEAETRSFLDQQAAQTGSRVLSTPFGVFYDGHSGSTIQDPDKRAKAEQEARAKGATMLQRAQESGGAKDAGTISAAGAQYAKGNQVLVFDADSKRMTPISPRDFEQVAAIASGVLGLPDAAVSAARQQLRSWKAITGVSIRADGSFLSFTPDTDRITHAHSVNIVNAANNFIAQLQDDPVAQLQFGSPSATARQLAVDQAAGQVSIRTQLNSQADDLLTRRLEEDLRALQGR